MRILVVAACPLPWPRGTPIRIHRMAEALLQRGHEIHMATYPLGHADTPTPYQTHRVGWKNMRLRSDPGPSLKKLFVLDPLLTRRIRRLLDEMSFDVIHAHHYEGLIAALLARRSGNRVPIVYDAHTLLGSELPHYRLPMPEKTAAWLGRYLDSTLPRRADHVIAVTERMREWLITEGGVPAARTSLISNGVEYEHFAVPAVAENNSQATGNDVAPLRIVFSGNLAEYQGIDLLLSAFQRVHAEVSHARLILVTDSDCTDLMYEVGKLGLTDYVSTIQADYASLPTCLAAANVLVNPRPQCEGIPQKLLNYMAAGRPIVSFSSSAALLEHDRTALLVADEDIDGFAQAILRILREPQLGQRLSRAASEQVEAKYGWQNVAQKVEDAYAQVIGNAARAP